VAQKSKQGFSFLKKRNKKLLFHFDRNDAFHGAARLRGIKSFLLLFFKKEVLPFLLIVCLKD
jgi:hypothetical protein